MSDRRSTWIGSVAGAVMVASLSQAQRLKRRFDAVISLEDPDCRPSPRLRFNQRPAPAHLVLAFEDVDDDALGVRVATRDQVEQAILFARTHSHGSLLVHCLRGLGRSTAIALGIISDRFGPFAEANALQSLLELRPGAIPNLVVVKLADEVLGRQGRLIDAVALWEAATPGLQEAREARMHSVRSSPQLYSRA